MRPGNAQDMVEIQETKICPPDIHLDWNGLSQVEWENLLSQAKGVSLQQSWAYGAALVERGAKVRRFVACRNNRPIALAQVIVRSYYGVFRMVTLMRGPVWLVELSTQEKLEVLRQIRALYPRRQRYFLILTPEEEAPNMARAMIRHGFHQVITGYSTSLVSLEGDGERLWAGLYGKWRNQVRKAQKAGLVVRFGGYDHPLTDWLLSLEKKQQTEKNYRGLPVSLVEAFDRHCLKSSGVITAFVYARSEQDEPLAAAMFLGHGAGATYHIGWNSKWGRKSHALNLLLWESLLHLKKEGYRVLDLGGMNTVDSAELTRFKLGLGGEVKRLIGSYM